MARALLLKFLWDKEQVITKFCENENLTRQIFNYDMNVNNISKQASDNILCPVCYCESSSNIGMECGHQLCYECYKQYLQSQVEAGPDSLFTTCP